MAMASSSSSSLSLSLLLPTTSLPHYSLPPSSVSLPTNSSLFLAASVKNTKTKKRPSMVVQAAIGELSTDSNTYLIAGAIGIALVGTAFPILFFRKDQCPECEGAGFIRKSGVALRANAARKDESQIVCPRCNGLGKLNQIDK